MGREPEDEALDELRMPDGQPLGIVAARRDAHHAHRAPPLLADDGGVVVGDVAGGAPGRQVRAPADLDERQVMPGDDVEPALPRATR